MSDLVGLGLIMWALVLFFYINACFAEGSFIGEKPAWWAYPGLALGMTAVVVMALGLLYLLAQPMVYLFGG